VRTAIPLRDVVGKAQNLLVVAVVPPQRGLDGDAVFFRPHGDRCFDQRMFGPVQIADEGLKPAIVVEFFDDVFHAALVGQDNAHAGVQESEFPQAVLQRAEVEIRSW
jgi:hypothetical protein